MTEAEIRVDGKLICNADITFRVVDFPKGEFLDHMHDVAKRHRAAAGVPAAWLTPRATPGSPASASSPASAKGRMRIGRRFAPAPPAGRRNDLRRLTSSTASPPLNFDTADPEEGRSAPDGAVAAHRHLCRWPCARIRRARRAMPNALTRTDMIVAAGGGERDIAVDSADPEPATARPTNPRLSSTSG